MHMTIRCHTRIAGLPWHQAERIRVTDSHVVAISVWLHAHARQCKTRKTGAIRDHGIVVLNRHRFRFRSAVYVNKLRQHVLDAVLF